MRGKIFAVFAVIVLVLGGLSYALSRVAITDLTRPPAPPRALGSVARLHLDALVVERWIAAQAADPKVREPLNAGTAPARGEGATAVANKIREAASASPDLAGIPVSLVVLVDKKGVVLGRNGSALMRGDNLAAVYPTLKLALDKGIAASDAWVSRARTEQMLASFAPIRDADGSIVGAIAVGTVLDDGRLTEVSERSSNGILVAAVVTGGALDIVAKSKDATPELLEALRGASARDGVAQALASNQVVDLGGLPTEYTAFSHSLDGYGNGRQVALISATRRQVSSAIGSLLWPTLAIALLGLALVGAGAHFLDNYISRPISEIEDGLLAIINGRTDLRFEIEHAELGGLVFRLNSLLNQLFGVQEDETDDEGRASRVPDGPTFSDVLSVDESMATVAVNEIAESRALRDEAADGYYDRIFGEYLDAKNALGDPGDPLAKQAFVNWIMTSEREMSDKHARPMRYKVEVRGREVVLLAVPLA